MEFVCKRFDELCMSELYEILKVRAAVFVVEQNCPYQDIDEKDKQALHLFFRHENGSICAYLRVLMKEDEPCTAHIGRVLTTERKTGLGGRILSRGIAASFDILKADGIYIEAQVYAKGFYERERFKQVSGEFLEDGIPHICMRLKKENRV